MTIDPRTPAEKRFDAERDGSLYFEQADADYEQHLADVVKKVTHILADNDAAQADKPILDASPVTVTRCWSDQDDNPDAPPEGASVWTDYDAGSVVIGVGETDYVTDIHIFGVRMEEQATLAALTQAHTDLGHLLADARVRAALPSGDELSLELPPTQMMRIRDFKAACSFPLALSLQVGSAISRDRARLGLTEAQMYDVLICASQVIEDMFDLTVGLGILGNGPTKLADMAYERGWREALDAIKGFLELKEKAPEKAAALLGMAL